MVHWGSYGWGSGMGLGWVIMIVFWILVILGVVYLVKLFAGGERRIAKESALDILKKDTLKVKLGKKSLRRLRSR